MIIDFETVKNEKTSNLMTDGNLALDLDYIEQEKELYIEPEIKKLVLAPPKKKDTRIFMGCYQYNYQANDGDGC